MAFGITKKCKLCGQCGELRCGAEKEGGEETYRVLCRNVSCGNQTTSYDREEDAVISWEVNQ